MTDKQKNKIRKWQHYKFWKKQVVELNSTLDLDIYVLPMIVEQMYNVLEQKNGHHYAWQAKKSYEAMKLACDDWQPFNGINGYGDSIDSVFGKPSCDPSTGCC
jgi:hypothetical protein